MSASGSDSVWPSLLQKADANPRRAVFDAFDILAGTAVRVASSNPLTLAKLDDAPSGDQAARVLVASNLIEPEVFETYVRLRDLRDELITRPVQPYPDDAARYVDLARLTSGTIATIDRVGVELSPSGRNNDS